MNESRQLMPALLALAASIGISVAGPAVAWDDDDDDSRQTPCERTADTMFKACLFEVGDDLYVTLANCKNISDRDARRDAPG